MTMMLARMPRTSSANDGRHVVGNALAFFVLEDHLVDEVADDAGEEHHEGVHHALHQRQGDHVAVGHVADFVGQYRTHFIGREALEQALGHRDQRVVRFQPVAKALAS
jgi:hypothetical protein